MSGEFDLAKVVKLPAHRANYSQGRQGLQPSKLVIHVSQGSMGSMDRHFADPKALVSAHFGISKAGEVHQYVSTADTAWHAGDWQVNLRSIGIEHEGLGDQYVPTEAQYATSLALARTLCRSYDIVPSAETILPHRAVRATKCPAGFPMERYIADLAGIEEAGQPVELYDPVTNRYLGEGTLVGRKVYPIRLVFKDVA